MLVAAASCHPSDGVPSGVNLIAGVALFERHHLLRNFLHRATLRLDLVTVFDDHASKLLRWSLRLYLSNLD